MNDASTTPSLRVSKASASAFTATPMEQDFLSAMAFRSARDFLELKAHVLHYWSEENNVLQVPAPALPSSGALPSEPFATDTSLRPAGRRKRLVIESAFALNSSQSDNSSPASSPSPLRVSHDAPPMVAARRGDAGGWTSGATRTAITRSSTVRECTSLFENIAGMTQSTPAPSRPQPKLPFSLLTKQELTALKKQRRLSFGFAHSWEFNNTDVTHDFEVPGIGNLHKYLQSRFDAQSGIVPSDEKRRSYILDSANATRLRMSIANSSSLHTRVNSAPSGPVQNDVNRASLTQEYALSFSFPPLFSPIRLKSFRDSLKGSSDPKNLDGQRRTSIPTPASSLAPPSAAKRLISLPSTSYMPSPRSDMNNFSNIVKEETDDDGVLVRATLLDGNKIIVAGTKDALIRALISDKAQRSDLKQSSQDAKVALKGVADPDFTMLFLMTHARIADSSVDLLKHLINEYFGGDRKKKVKAKDVDDRLVKERYMVSDALVSIIEIIHEWLEKFYYHFIPEQMSDLLKKLLKDISKGTEEEKNWAKILRDTISLKQTEHNNQESLLFIAKQVIGESAKLKGKNVKTQKIRKEKAQALETKYGDGHNVSFLEVDHKVMAEQIILLDCALMSSLSPNHLLGDVDVDNKVAEVSRVRRQSHNLVMWVASEICTTINIKQRTMILSKFIELALYLFHMRDFEGFLNIYNGLNKPQVKRLAGTWRGVDQGIVKSFQNLKRKIDEQGLGQFFDMATLSESPKIPPLVLLLDFLHLQTKAPETYKDTQLLNFVKYRAIGNLLLSLHTAEWIGFFFEPIMPLQTYLQKHLTVLSETELTVASERIQKKKGGTPQRSHRSSSADLRPKPKTEVSSKRKSIDRFFGRKSVTAGRSSESKNDTIKRELIAKWDRPLAQVSVHADVPRMVNKMLVLNKKTGPPSVWPSSDETASTSLHSIRGLFESLMRGLGMPELYTKEDFLKYFDKPEDDDSDIQQTVNDYMHVLGEEHTFVKLLKCACSQGIVAPVWTWIKMVLLAGFPFKDVKLGWLVYVIFEGQVVHIIHQKKEQSNHDEEEPPRDPGDFDFEFTWELRMTFDIDLSRMENASFGISHFNMSSQIPGGMVKKLDKRVKSWKIDSSVAPEIQYLENARNVAAATRSPINTQPVNKSYDDFKKLVITNSDGIISEAAEDDADSRRSSKSKASPKRRDSTAKIDEQRLSGETGQGRRFKYRAQRDSFKTFYRGNSDDEAPHK